MEITSCPHSIHVDGHVGKIQDLGFHNGRSEIKVSPGHETVLRDGRRAGRDAEGRGGRGRDLGRLTGGHRVYNVKVR